MRCELLPVLHVNGTLESNRPANHIRNLLCDLTTFTCTQQNHSQSSEPRLGQRGDELSGVDAVIFPRSVLKRQFLLISMAADMDDGGRISTDVCSQVFQLTIWRMLDGVALARNGQDLGESFIVCFSVDRILI